MEVRMMTPEEEAVMNMELFKTEELFLKRVKAAVLTLLREDTEVQTSVDIIAQRRVQSFKQNLSSSISNAINNTH